MEKMVEPRFLRGCACRNDAELETTEGVMDKVDDCLDLRSTSGRSARCWELSTGDVVCGRVGGTLFVVEPSLEKRWSLEVREGAEVKLVD
jgi:hypothetical protein